MFVVMRSLWARGVQRWPFVLARRHGEHGDSSRTGGRVTRPYSVLSVSLCETPSPVVFVRQTYKRQRLAPPVGIGEGALTAPRSHATETPCLRTFSISSRSARSFAFVSDC